MAVSAWRIEAKGVRNTPEALHLPSNLRFLDQASMRLPGGVYTTFRTFERSKAIHLEDHFDRLEHSARLAGQAEQIDRSLLRDALRSIVRLASEGQDSRIRITLDLEECLGDVYVLCQSLAAPPAEAYRDGARLVIREMHRLLPEAKLTGFIARAEILRQSLPEEVEEALLTDSQGHLLEGLSSNFFAVMEGQLWTAGEGMLAGITRRLVSECAEKLSIPLVYQAAKISDLGRLEEAFITSSSRGVLPVVQIDEAIIGSGQPGPLTKRLAAAYAALVEEQCEEI